MDRRLFDRVAMNPATLLTYLHMGNQAALEMTMVGVANRDMLKDYLLGVETLINKWNRGVYQYESPTFAQHVIDIIDKLPPNSPLRKDPLDALAQTEVEGHA